MAGRSSALALASLLLALTQTAAQAAQMYRWTDKEGRVHFTDTPPPPDAQETKTVTAADGASATSRVGEAVSGNETPAERTARLQRAAAGIAADRQARDRSKAEDQAAKRERDKHCQQLRSEWNNMERAGRKYVVDENNQQRNLSDDEVKQLESLLQDEMRKSCGS